VTALKELKKKGIAEVGRKKKTLGNKKKSREIEPRREGSKMGMEET